MAKKPIHIRKKRPAGAEALAPEVEHVATAPELGVGERVQAAIANQMDTSFMRELLNTRSFQDAIRASDTPIARQTPVPARSRYLSDRDIVDTFSRGLAINGLAIRIVRRGDDFFTIAVERDGVDLITRGMTIGPYETGRLTLTLDMG